jgi:uncharacterized protein YjbJ (UPF0337 family)
MPQKLNRRSFMGAAAAAVAATGFAAGAAEEATGKVFGDAKLVVDGKHDKAEGKVQNAVGGIKDVLKK